MRLNDDVRALLTAASDCADFRVRRSANVSLAKCSDSEKNTTGWKTVTKTIDSTVKIPDNIKEFMIYKQPNDIHMDTYVRLPEYTKLLETCINQHNVANQMDQLGIHYPLSVLLHGPSGTGKTEFVKWFAKEQNLPYIQVNYATLIDSHLGKTANNIFRLFEFIRSFPCVLCLDELDAIGTTRNNADTVKEVKNITIQLMQSFDTLENESVVFGTTNRLNDLDSALVRRFRLVENFPVLSYEMGMKFIGLYLEHISERNSALSSHFVSLVKSRLDPFNTASSDLQYDDSYSIATLITTCNDVIANLISEGIVNTDEGC